MNIPDLPIWYFINSLYIEITPRIRDNNKNIRSTISNEKLSIPKSPKTRLLGHDHMVKIPFSPIPSPPIICHVGGMLKPIFKDSGYTYGKSLATLGPGIKNFQNTKIKIIRSINLSFMLVFLRVRIIV